MGSRSVLLFGLSLTVALTGQGQSTESKEIRGVPGGLARAVSGSDFAEVERCLKESFADGVPKASPVVLFARSARMLDFLLAHGANLWAVDGQGMNVLMVAAQDGDLELTRVLLGRGAKVNAKDFSGRSALYFAAGNLDEKVADVLLRAGAYVDIQSSDGATVLHRAAEQFNLPVFELLLASGADWRLEDRAGRDVREFIEHGEPPPLDDKERTIRATMLARLGG